MADYSTYNKGELLTIIAKQEKELKTKKYGLVWDSEREPEQVVLDCENNLPILKRVKGKEIKTDDSEDNILIEGDNYHALTVLNYTHKEKIDVIYIDPPYNTGNKDFIYNDRYVDKEDGYKHSKWLNFMEKRLNLARELLKKDGVIFISIDDNEVAQLKLLCDNIFGKDNFIAQVLRVSSPTQNISKFVSVMHDYCLIYCKDKIQNEGDWQVKKNGANEFEQKANRLLKSDLSIKEVENELKQLVKYPRFFDFDHYYYVDKNGVYQTVSAGGVKKGNVESILIHPKTKIPCKIPENGWRYKEQKIKKLERDGLWHFGQDESTIPRKKLYLHDYIMQKPKGIGFFDSQVDIKFLKNLNLNFDFPKPVSFLNWILQMATSRSSIVLDFMAGSGTTGQAVLQLNKEDNGNRKFILCTNNEGNICTDVTYPRIQTVIKGYKKNGNGDKVEGLNGNLQYFKTDLIKKTNNRDQVKINLTKKCTEMLCVKENNFNLKIEESDYKIFSSNKNNRFLCIYYNFIEDTFSEFYKEIKKLKGKKIVYMFSIENIVNKSLFSGIKNIKIEAIPQNILDVYKQLVKMNIPVKTNVIFTDLNKAKNKIFSDQDKDDGARVLRVVLEKVIQKFSQDNSINILNKQGKEEKVSALNDKLYNQNIITQIEWEENKTFLTIGNNAAHGEYDDYDLSQVEKFYKHIQSLLNSYNV